MVKWAHKNGIKVVPVNGPSSIILALISSGFNGQQFAFHGYLPIDKDERKNKIRQLEKQVQETGYSQIFMETPYRNQRLLEDLCKFLSPQTALCIAADINNPETEFIKTLPIKEWQKEEIDLHKNSCNICFRAMKKLKILFCIFFFAIQISAQQFFLWKGGHRGRDSAGAGFGNKHEK